MSFVVQYFPTHYDRFLSERKTKPRMFLEYAVIVFAVVVLDVHIVVFVLMDALPELLLMPFLLFSATRVLIMHSLHLT